MDDVTKQLLHAFLESAEALKLKIDTLERIIERQGIDKLDPGTVVDKAFCLTSHEELETNVCGRADKLEETFCGRLKNFEVGVNRKIYASWLVLVVACSAIGWAVKTNSVFIHELTKLVFK